MTATIKLDTTVLDRIARQAQTKAEKVVEALAFEVEARAKTNSPVITGALMSSIYTVTREHDGFSAAASAARGANPKVELVRIPTPTGKAIANVGPCVDYGGYVELGTSRKGARPYLAPAVQTILFKFGLPSTWREVVE